MASETFTKKPGQISNRAFIHQMERWGWVQKRVKGDVTQMVAPNGHKIEVASAHISKGNSSATINAVCDYMGMKWEEFMDLTAEQAVMLENVMKGYADPDERAEAFTNGVLRALLDRALEAAAEDSRRRQMDRERNEQRKREAKEAAAKAKEATMQGLAVVKEDGSSLPVREAQRQVGNRGASNAVLEALIDAGEPMTLRRLSEVTGLKQGVCSNAATYLTNQGLATRVKSGMCSVKVEHLRQDVRVDVVARAGQPEAPQTPQETPEKAPVAAQTVTVGIPPAAPVTAPEKPVVDTLPTSAGQPPKPVVASDYNGTINEVLDLMFPAGFKAKHLPLIDRWREATSELMREIEADGQVVR